MFELVKNTDRGFTNLGWLKSYHTFSFGNYYNPHRAAFRSLRVINEDFVAPGKGFDFHSHSNMEILTYVLKGALTHQDSMGNEKVISSGEFQYMSAGSGVLHSEYNASNTEEVHFIQIWITPNHKNLSPRYAEFKPANFNKLEELTLIASEDGDAGSLPLRQHASLYAGRMFKEQSINYQIKAGHGVWIYQLAGKMQLGALDIEPGDSVSIQNEKAIDIAAKTDANFLLFDLA
jgi:quercetin 2,3-dioxygenase